MQLKSKAEAQLLFFSVIHWHLTVWHSILSRREGLGTHHLPFFGPGDSSLALMRIWCVDQHGLICEAENSVLLFYTQKNKQFQQRLR